MTFEKLIARIEEAVASERKLAVRHGRSPCPECEDRGPHEDNGESGQALAFLCRRCGFHFDAEEWV